MTRRTFDYSYCKTIVIISQNGGFFILKLAMAKKVALENLISKKKVLQFGDQTLKRCLPAKLGRGFQYKSLVLFRQVEKMLILQ